MQLCCPTFTYTHTNIRRIHAPILQYCKIAIAPRCAASDVCVSNKKILKQLLQKLICRMCDDDEWLNARAQGSTLTYMQLCRCGGVHKDTFEQIVDHHCQFVIRQVFKLEKTMNIVLYLN